MDINITLASIFTILLLFCLMSIYLNLLFHNILHSIVFHYKNALNKFAIGTNFAVFFFKQKSFNVFFKRKVYLISSELFTIHLHTFIIQRSIEFCFVFFFFIE